LQAAIDLNRGIANAEHALTLRPFHDGLGETAGKVAERLKTAIIHPHEAESAKTGTQIGGKIMEFREHREMLGGEFSAVNVSSFENAFGDRLGSDANQQGAPVIDGKLA